MKFVSRVLLTVLILSMGPIGHAEEGLPHLYFGCEIYDIRSPASPVMLRRFAGELCLFQDDGSVLQVLSDRVAKYDSKMKEVWSLPTRAHHQLNLSNDGKEILIIGSEAVLADKKSGRARSDVLFVVDQNGKIKKRFSFFENRKQFQQKAWQQAVDRKFPMIWNLKIFKDVSWELTHANSFYEIPSHQAESKKPEFKNRNYIVNDISLMMAFSLDSSLKKVLWQKSLRPEHWNMIHDVQILQNGHMLYYDNGTKENPKSALREVNLLTDKEVWSFTGFPGAPFYSKRWGGLQRLPDGGTLYTDITHGPEIVELDANGKKRWSWRPGDGKYLQQARKSNLGSFLKNNRAL